MYFTGHRIFVPQQYPVNAISTLNVHTVNMCTLYHVYKGYAVASLYLQTNMISPLSILSCDIILLTVSLGYNYNIKD